MVAAAVVPFSSVGPEHDVDRDTDLMMHEHMGGNDVVPLIGKSEKKPHAAAEEAATATPMDAETYASAVAESGGVLATGTAPAAGAKKTSSKSTAKSSRRAGAASRKAAASDDDSSGWPTPLVVVPAVFDEWDAPEGARHASDAIPDWATPGARDGYSMASNFYQRRFEEDADFVPNRGYETSVYIKFIIDHYRNLPDVTAFVKGSFAPVDAKARLKAVAKKAKKIGFQPLTVDVDGANERLRSPDGFDPELGFVRSRSPGELVQMWKNRKWGWEDIMGDTAGAAAAHLSRCWRGLGAEFASAASDEQADVGQYMFHASHPKKHEMGGELVEVTPGIPQREQALASAEPAPEVSEADKRELSLPAPSISAYPGGSFAVSKERLRRVPLETWKALYQRFAVDGTCLPIDEESAEALRDDIRDKFDLGVSLEHLSHVIFGGERLDAGEDARCCGAECALQDAACAKSSSSKSSKKSSKAASHQPTREEAAEAHMRVVEEKIGRYNGWNLRELRVERAAETASPDERETAALSELGAAREVEPTDKKEAAEAAEAASTKESSASSTKESSSTKSSSKKASSKKASAAGKRESSDASEKKVKQEFYIPKDWEKERDGEHPPQTNPAWKRFVDEEQKHIDDAEKEEAEAEALHPSDEDSEQPTAAELEAERKAASKESEKTAMFEDRIAQLEEENEALKFQQKQAIAAREEEKVKLMRLAKEEIDALDAKEEALKTTVNAMKKENAKTADDLEEKLEYAEARERDAAAKRRDAVATAQKLRARLEHQRTRGHSEGAAGAAEEEENGELEEKLESAERALREKEIEVEQEKQKRIEIAEAARALRERLAAIRGDKTAHAQGAAKDAAAKAKKPAAADAAQKPAATEAAQKPTVHKPAAADAAQKPAAQKPAAAAQKPVAAKVGAADASDVAALALPPRRRTNPAAQQSEIAPSKDAVETERRRR